MPIQRRVIKVTQAARRAFYMKKKAKRAPRTTFKLVKGVIKRMAETKMATFFNGPVANPAPLANSTGLFTQAAPVSQNPFIQNNPTDILKLIPDVPQGDGDNERSGRYIMPVSCRVRCKVMLSPTSTGSTGWASPQATAYDLTIVAYLLQSVTFKTYRTLYVDNDFSKMLDVGNGSTTQFDGSFSAANMPVEKGYYRVHKVVRKQLRSSGIFSAPGGAINQITNNNSHNLRHEWVWDLTKYLPKKLVYPENQVTAANGGNEPLNSSLFWCVGYYKTDGTPANAQEINIQQEYTSLLKYKDF